MVEATNKSGHGGVKAASNRVWWIVLSLLLASVYGCSSRSDVDVEAETNTGGLELPLTYESEAGRYRLAATFAVFDQPVSPSNEPEPVLTLTSQPPPAAAEPQLSAELPAGEYWVALQNWRLYRDDSDVWVGIDAEPTATVAAVTILAEQTSTVTFRFVTTPPAGPRGGTLVVDFTVSQGALCGNGVLEPGEVCDDGVLNGLPNHCNATCSPEPEPPPALRVDPGAETNGSGKSWEAPMNDVQAALDVQGQAGGGEVWVLGGRFAALTSAGETLLNVPSHVTLRGGFGGVETTLAERDPEHEPTWFERPDPEAPDVPLIAFADVSDAMLERIAIDDVAIGPTGISVRNSRGVVLRDLTMPSSYRHATALELIQSEVRIEGSHIDLTGQELSATDSDVAIVDTSILGWAIMGGVYFRGSRVLFDGVVSERHIVASDGPLLFHRSHVVGSSERGGMISASSGELTFLASALLDEGTGLTPLSGDSVLVFDSTFANLRGGTAGGNYSRAAAVEAETGEVALSTFYNAVCIEMPAPYGCRTPIRLRDNGPVHNSVLVQLEPPPSNPYPRDPYDWFFVRTDQQFANCATFEIDAFQRSESVPDQVLATAHPCIDAGDAEALEAARRRLLQRVAEFRGPPFNADLSRYDDPDFWRHSTARTDTTEDTGAPDPGRHWPLAAP